MSCPNGCFMSQHCPNCGTVRDRLTPEERAVIEAAEAFESNVDAYSRCTDKLLAAIRALRASRQPKPRYWAEPTPAHVALASTHGWMLVDRGKQGQQDRTTIGYFFGRDNAEMIAKMMNEADQ